MNLVILGATGGAGRALFEGALELGHTVTAAVRTPAKVSTEHDRLRIARTDVTRAEAVRAAVVGQDAVLSAFGVGNYRPFSRPTTVYSEGTRHILDARNRQHAVLGRHLRRGQSRPQRTAFARSS